MQALLCECLNVYEIVDEEELYMSEAREIGPKHYKGLGYEPWDIMYSNFTNEEFEGYLRGNVVKYILRYPSKGGVDDLRKARHYIDRLIELKEE
jgi:hypothetical protein